MGQAGRRVFWNSQEWAEAWEGTPAARRPFWRGRPANSADELGQAAHFLAGALLAHRFRLFHHGGLPVLERRYGPLVQEILVRQGGINLQSGHRPIRIDVHLSHQDLRAVRERYWRPASRAPVLVASGDVGELDLPPAKVLWFMDGDPQTLEDMARTVRRLAVRWLDTFQEPNELRSGLFGGLPLIDHQTAIELLLAESNHREARDYLRKFVTGDEKMAARFWGELDILGQARKPRFEDSTPEHRLAAIAHSYHLI